MADSSTYPGTLDGDLKALVGAVEPTEAGDFFMLLADAVTKMQAELGTNPSDASSTVAARLAAMAEAIAEGSASAISEPIDVTESRTLTSEDSGGTLMVGAEENTYITIPEDLGLAIGKSIYLARVGAGQAGFVPSGEVSLHALNDSPGCAYGGIIQLYKYGTDAYIVTGAVDALDPPPAPPGWETEVLLDNPVALWLLNEDAAVEAIDTLGNSNPWPYVSPYTPQSNGFLPQSDSPGVYGDDDVALVAMGFKPSNVTPPSPALNGDTVLLVPLADAEVEKVTIGFWAKLPYTAQSRIHLAFSGEAGVDAERSNFVLQFNHQAGDINFHLTITTIDTDSDTVVGTRTWQGTGTPPVADGGWHFYSVVIDRNDGPDVLVDDEIMDTMMSGFTLSPPSSGPWPADWLSGVFSATARDAGTSEDRSGFAAGLYVIPGELDPERRSAHYTAITPA